MPEERKIGVTIRNAAMGDKKMNVSNRSMVSELKETYGEMLASKVQKDNIRFFSLGKELKNEFALYNYDITSDMVIQAMIRPGWEEHKQGVWRSEETN